MTGIALGVPPAKTRQEVVELIGFLGASTRELESIETRTEQAIAEAKAKAEALAGPIRAAINEAQARVQAWFRVHPEQAHAVPGSDQFISPMDAQLAAVVLTTARPLTLRQVEILEGLKQGMVLRRLNRNRSYSLIWPDRPAVGRKVVSTNHVFDLQHRFLDAHDVKTGERVLGGTAYDKRNLEFRIKPDVVLP
jgi:hypothetical protein